MDFKYKIKQNLLTTKHIEKLLQVKDKCIIFEGSPSYNKFKTLHQHPLIFELLDYMKYIVQTISGYSLISRYGHIYLYEKGQTLTLHQDLGDCFISSSTCIAKAEDGPSWSLEVKSKNQIENIYLKANETIIFKSNLWHGRLKPLEQSWQLQLMLMYSKKG